MITTRVFKSGNSQAVRIPKEFQFENTDMELEISRTHDGLVIRPVHKKLIRVLDKFARFSSDFMQQGRETSRDPKRSPL